MATGKKSNIRAPKQYRSTVLTQHLRLFSLGLLATVLLPAWAGAAALASLKTVPVIDPVNLQTSYVRDKIAAVQLGKALFWDMQVGSDGVTACASCHFHAGADSRTRNQLNPGTRGGDDTFANNRIGLPVTGVHSNLDRNIAVTRSHFPFHNLSDLDDIGEPLHNPENVVSSVNDVMGSQGVPRRNFVDISIGNPVDQGTPVDDPVFANLRQVTGRNANSVINAAFNFTNFWDGRANNIFNGKTPFGPADPERHVFVNSGGTLVAQAHRIRQAALASQAVGPPLNDVEMSWRGRTWHKLGKKMLSLRPLNQQKVHASDSVLGPIAASATTGLNTNYATLIRRAFYPRLWGNTTHHLELENPADPTSPLSPTPILGPADPNNTSQFNQMEANFSLFFGLAVQLYEATLIADDSKLDRFLEGNGALTPEEQRGLAVFNGAGSCIVCHAGPETTDAGVAGIQGADAITGIAQPVNQNPLNANELMPFAIGTGFYDTPFHNLGVRPGGLPSVLASNEDIGRGGNSDFTAADPGNPSNTFPIPLSWGTLAVWKTNPALANTTVPMPASLSPFVPPLPFGMKATTTAPLDGQVSNFGAFKTPHLRNVELTGPYMHNGGFATLHQVVEFYTRGGDFPATNAADFDTTIIPLGILLGSDVRKNELVAFLQTLTDERVKNENAPFDHPELFVPVEGAAPVSPTGTREGFINASNVVTNGFMRIPQVGAAGRTAQGLPQVGTFLNLHPTLP